MNLKELLKLAGEQGKVVVVDDSGDVKGVFLSFEAYQILTDNEIVQIPVESEAERINRQILEAQLNEDVPTPQISPGEKHTHVDRLDSLLSKRAEQLFKSVPNGRAPRTIVDMRSEVIDPNYDFSMPESSDDEVLRPNFDDI